MRTSILPTCKPMRSEITSRATATTSSVFMGTSTSGLVSRFSTTFTARPAAVTWGVTEMTSASWSMCHVRRRATDSVVTVAWLPLSVWMRTALGRRGFNSPHSSSANSTTASSTARPRTSEKSHKVFVWVRSRKLPAVLRLFCTTRNDSSGKTASRITSASRAPSSKTATIRLKMFMATPELVMLMPLRMAPSQWLHRNGPIIHPCAAVEKRWSTVRLPAASGRPG